jgi:acetyl esterase
MPMDQATAEFVKSMSGFAPRPWEDGTSAADLQRFIAGAASRMPVTRPLPRVEDRTIPGPAGELPIRVYWPVAEARRLPVVVFFHGGGWVIGNLDTHDDQCRAFAELGEAIVVSVDYRLAPRHPYPAAVEDAYAATWWVALHAAELGGDPTRIAVAGDSAGGNLAAVVALRSREQGPALKFQLLIYPGVGRLGLSESAREFADDPMLSAAAGDWYFQQYTGGRFSRRADGRRVPWTVLPMFAESLAGSPPAFVLTAEVDVLRDDGEAYARRLAAEGVPTTAYRADGMFHGFLGVLQFLPAGLPHLAVIGTVLRDAL